MKHMKRMASLLMALVMALSLAVPVMAADETGSITINGVSDTTTYDIYRLLDLQSYDKDKKTYSYRVNSAWKTFFATDEAKAYISLDADGFATWVGDEEDEARIAAFAKLALAYAKANNITPVKSSATEGQFEISGTSGVFSNLALGYYLVDSTMGALCGLTTTNPDASIQAKNGQPTIDKQVKEDSTNKWGESNSADIGQTVEFCATISVHAGAQNYVFHDKMDPGLTYTRVSKIEHVVPSENKTTEVPQDQYYNIIVATEITDECTFEIHFTQSFCDHLKTNDKVIIYYEAVLNNNAVIANPGNVNEAWLTYGEGNETTHDTTTTYTYQFDIVKTDSQNTLIDGAEFRIYDAATGGNEVKVKLQRDGTYLRYYGEEGGDVIKVKDGKVRVKGFDNGTYYLEETKSPNGYNQLSARKEFTIADANLDSVFNGDIYSTGSGVHVVNKAGTMLPETGGMGTTLFYVLGGVLVIGAGVALVTKKRMG